MNASSLSSHGAALLLTDVPYAVAVAVTPAGTENEHDRFETITRFIETGKHRLTRIQRTCRLSRVPTLGLVYVPCLGYRPVSEAGR